MCFINTFWRACVCCGVLYSLLVLAKPKLTPGNKEEWREGVIKLLMVYQTSWLSLMVLHGFCLAHGYQHKLPHSEGLMPLFLTKNKILTQWLSIPNGDFPDSAKGFNRDSLIGTPDPAPLQPWDSCGALSSNTTSHHHRQRRERGKHHQQGLGSCRFCWGDFLLGTQTGLKQKMPHFCSEVAFFKRKQGPPTKAAIPFNHIRSILVSKLRELELLKHKKNGKKPFHFQCFIVTWSFWKYQGNKKQRQQQLPGKKTIFNRSFHRTSINKRLLFSAAQGQRGAGDKCWKCPRMRVP